jgi:hypothetical protein
LCPSSPADVKIKYLVEEEDTSVATTGTVEIKKEEKEEKAALSAEPTAENVSVGEVDVVIQLGGTDQETSSSSSASVGEAQPISEEPAEKSVIAVTTSSSVSGGDGSVEMSASEVAPAAESAKKQHTIADIDGDEDEDSPDEDYVPGGSEEEEEEGESDNEDESMGSEEESGDEDGDSVRKKDKGKGREVEVEIADVGATLSGENGKEEEEEEDQDWEPSAKKRRRESDSDSGSDGSSGSDDSDDGEEGDDEEDEEDEEDDEDFVPDEDRQQLKHIDKRPRLIPPNLEQPVKTVTIAELMNVWEPVRAGEVGWVQTGDLNLLRTGCTTRPPYWPILIFSTPPSSIPSKSSSNQDDGDEHDPFSMTVNVMPLPLPTPPEIQMHTTTTPNPPPWFSPKPDTYRTPSHYTNRSLPLIVGPRTVVTETVINFGKLPKFPDVWAERVRYNRGLIQAVGASVTWEVLEYKSSSSSSSTVTVNGNGVSGTSTAIFSKGKEKVTAATVAIVSDSSHVSPFETDPDEREEDVLKLRWGSEVIQVGDWVRVVTPDARKKAKALRGHKYIWGATSEGRAYYLSLSEREGQSEGGVGGSSSSSSGVGASSSSAWNRAPSTPAVWMMKLTRMVRVSVASLHFMENTSASKSQKPRMELEGEVYQFNHNASEGQLLGLGRFPASKHLIGRWYGVRPHLRKMAMREGMEGNVVLDMILKKPEMVVEGEECLGLGAVGVVGGEVSGLFQGWLSQRQASNAGKSEEGNEVEGELTGLARELESKIEMEEEEREKEEMRRVYEEEMRRVEGGGSSDDDGDGGSEGEMVELVGSAGGSSSDENVGMVVGLGDSVDQMEVDS